MQWHLEYPSALVGLGMVAALAAVMWVKGQRCRKSLSSWRRSFCVLVGLTLCVLALARPQLGRQVLENHSLRSNLFIAMDVSRSMMAQDVPPSRIQFAVTFAQRLLQRMATAKVALFPFAVEGYLMMPLTADIEAMTDMLSSLGPNVTTSQGTDLTNSLELLFRSIARMQQATESSGKEWFPAQVVLFSDGESHASVRDGILKEYRTRNIPIFTVGTGTKSGTTVPVESRFGQSFEALRDSQGKTVITQLVQKNLKHISEVTGGDYFPARLEEVEGLSNRLLQSMKFGKASTTFKLDKEYYPLLFTLAFLLFLVEFLFGRWHYAIRLLLAGLLLCAYHEPAQADLDKEPITLDDSMRAIKSYNAGVKASERKNFPKAAELFEESALLTQDKTLKKKALYNLADTLVHLSEPAQALSVLQQAYDTQSEPKAFDKETNKKISENMALAAKLIEQMPKQPKAGEGEGGAGSNNQQKDPKGPKKNYRGELFSDSQKQRIFDLISSEEQQTLQRLNEQKNRNRNASYQDKPW